ncbi:STAS domain-containing protein [Kribbella antibiotica]|uniref:STAS domain-containing protein n=1 Tax=Kribbella antibiotica TaxID=190195 RepID=UPI001404FF0B|nr:STAS domain-containing protein [Kribbella antibiotica]
MSQPQIVRTLGKPVDGSGSFVCAWSAVGGCVVVKVAGTVDAGSAPEFAEQLRRVITTKSSTVVVDVRRVRELGVEGVGVLAAAEALAREHGGWLRVAGGQPWLGDLLAPHAIPTYGELPHALPSYRPAP